MTVRRQRTRLQLGGGGNARVGLFDRVERRLFGNDDRPVRLRKAKVRFSVRLRGLKWMGE